MVEAAEWRGQVGDTWAEEWRRTDRALAPIQDALIEALRARLAGVEAPHVLDVGCGAGATSLAIAGSVPGARVTGIDLSESLIEAARDRAAGRADLVFETADAGLWTPPDGRPFDAVVSRHGVMFFDDPVAAFRHLRALGTADAPLVFSCFRARSDNQWVAALDPILARFAPEALSAPPPAVGPFAFADPNRIEAILTAAGFPAPRIAPLDAAFVVGEGADPVADAIGYLRRIGPFASLLKTLAPEREAAALAALRDLLARDCRNGRIAWRAAAWIVSA